MTLAISIAAAITVAVTAKLLYLMFLSGKKLTRANMFGRLMSSVEPAGRAFVQGWREQNWRYLFIAYPSMLATMGLVSLVLYWFMPALDRADTFGDKLRYCLLVFGVGVSASLTLSLVLILLVYFIISLVGAWWRQDDSIDAAPLPDAPVVAASSVHSAATPESAPVAAAEKDGEKAVFGK